MTVGNFGSESRFDYTAIGDAMNTAARLESLNKHLGTRICISQAVAGSLAPEAVRPVGDLVLKGRREALTVFEPLTPEVSASSALECYRQAYRHLAEERPAEARELFAELCRSEPDDNLAALHLARLEAGESGTRIVMTEK